MEPMSDETRPYNGAYVGLRVAKSAEFTLGIEEKNPGHKSVGSGETKISDGIRGSLEHYDNVRDLLKAIDDQFVSSDKALASTLIHQFSSMKLSGIHGVRDHIMRMRDIAAQLKRLEVQEVPQTDPNPVDPEVQQIPEIVEQFVEQHDPATQESVDAPLRTADPNSVDPEVQQIPEIVEQSGLVSPNCRVQTELQVRATKSEWTEG
ncbi:hypothetical protein ZIOFF_056293 [Zingiber officinale]|uniref:Uncharacterized protein n=1 Tax=Zingiber officinale TaxID=94328 RepID=A0A8J5KKY6_ZINOF|nr:hypothetical protein ZIOFF_056293 [Zingiber officinale]